MPCVTSLSAKQMILVLVFLLQWYNSQRTRHKVHRAALVSPRISPWRHLLQFGDCSSFLDFTGFTRKAFVELEKALGLKKRASASVGRPLLLDLRDQLGLYLFYVTSRCKLKHLCALFGIKLIMEKLQRVSSTIPMDAW